WLYACTENSYYMFRATANRPLAKMLRELLLVGLMANPDIRCASFHDRDASPARLAWHAISANNGISLCTPERPCEKPKTTFEKCHAGSRGSAPGARPVAVGRNGHIIYEHGFGFQDAPI